MLLTKSGQSLTAPEAEECTPAGGKSARRHRTLVDVIQDLEQENAEEAASTGMSPASERPVPLDLTCAVSEPVPTRDQSAASASTSDLPEQPPLPNGLLPGPRLTGSDGQPVPSPPG